MSGGDDVKQAKIEVAGVTSPLAYVDRMRKSRRQEIILAEKIIKDK